MLEIMQFIAQDFEHFVGSVIIICLTGTFVCLGIMGIGVAVGIARGKKFD